MKQNRFVTIIGSILIGVIHAAIAGTGSQPQIRQILVGPQGSDKLGNFSLNINLQVGTETYHNWEFGFYMPRNFRQTSQSNRNLVMKVCETGNKAKCSRLTYLKAPFTENDLSTVFTTIVKPTGDFPLKAGKNYTLSFLHNSSSGPQNYSSLPQNLFIISGKDDVFTLPSSPNLYTITNYQPNQVKAATQQHLIENWANSGLAAPVIGVIPSPSQVIFAKESGRFLITKGLTIHNFSQLPDEQLKLWQATIAEDLGLTPAIDTKAANSGIVLENRDTKLNNPEGYEIEIGEKQIKIRATNQAGFFYALQTLRQLWFNSTTIPVMEIKDAPRFKYRGILLDVARHYFTLDELKNFIDLMAAAKLNTLHLHLSDDEAFRLELDDFPELHKIGAKRGLDNRIGPMAFIQKNLSRNRPNDKLPTADTTYAGSYSTSQIKELINYANLHQITIIPEIDIPGHSRALMKALPDAFYEAGDNSEYAGFGDDSLPVCAYGSTSELGQKFTSTLTNIIYQATQLFDQQTTLYAVNNEISIGGDEVFSGTWNKAPSCKQAPWHQMDESAKEHYFLDLLNNEARINRLRLSGWNEFIQNKQGQINFKHGIKTDEVGHVWVWGKKETALNKAATLANAGYPVVLEYSDLLYMDMTYTQNIKEPGLYWANKSHDTNTMLLAALAADQTLNRTKNPGQIEGLEGALWTDVIPSYYHLQYMALPKIAGLSEASWSASPGQAPNWRSLAIRLGCGQTGFLAYIHDRFNANYRGYPNGIAAEAPQLCQSTVK